MIDLYTTSSPNGFKATIALEELALPYTVHHIKIASGDNRQPAFLSLNPYGRIPVIVDRETNITLFESAAILLYLAEKTGQLLPRNTRGRWAAIQWLQFHSCSMGPILGQRVHFETSGPKVPTAIERYRRLSEEAFAILDARLAKVPFLAGDEYSIADIATFAWVHVAGFCDFEMDSYKSLALWRARIHARPAVQKGIAIPEPATGP
ncbi:MAG: glutathione S-transferase family protein [Steroidobacteraceae bacterium]